MASSKDLFAGKSKMNKVTDKESNLFCIFT